MKTHLFTLLITLISYSYTAQGIDLFDTKEEGVVYEVGVNVYVKLVEQESAATGVNQHPINLDEELVKKALSSLRTREENVLDSLDLFTVGEINILSRNITRALTQAKAGEDVVFSVRKSKDRVLGLKDHQYYDAGRVFFKDNRLNLIMGDYDRPKLEGYEQAYDPTNMGITRYHFNHGSRASRFGKVELQTSENSGVTKASKDNRLDWVVIDLEVAATSFDDRMRNEKRAELNSRREELRALFGDDLGQGLSEQDRIQIQKDNLERRKLREEMARMRQQMNDGHNNTASDMSPEARLSRLKNLKDQDLISHEEYVLKRKEILSEL